MQRRKFIKGAITFPAFSMVGASLFPAFAAPPFTPFRRVRPGEPEWPSAATWEEFNQQVRGNLIKPESPLKACQSGSIGTGCRDVLKELKNPYYIGDQPALTQTSGWLDAWTSEPSAYAVAAKSTADIVAAVNFAREHHLRLVVKGGGHSYQGTSNSPDSLLIWTRAMNKIVLHDRFVAKGCGNYQNPQTAVTIEAGAMWGQVYDTVTTKSGRYVQGGGCTTVGVAGLIQSGGFGSFSKNYGLAAAGLLEAEIVTADGSVLTLNACNHPELFWAVKGGGGGSFGVITRLTLRTRDLPDKFGAAFGTIRAQSDTAFKELISQMMRHYYEGLFNPHWGEQIIIHSNNTISIRLLFQGIDQEKAKQSWKSFEDWVNERPDDFQWETPLTVVDLPAQHLWDSTFLKQYASQNIVFDDRPSEPEGQFYWSGDKDQVGVFMHGYRSAWLPASLLKENQQYRLREALFSASRHWPVSLHFNKGLAGAPAAEIAAASDTAINPAVLDAFALAIISGGSEPAFKDMPGQGPDKHTAHLEAGSIHQSMEELLKIVPKPGSYVSEGDFFEKNWKGSFWGGNYSRLTRVKNKYDPHGLFFVHHGVGSEEWSADGFTRLSGHP
ncbi:MAG: FAD-dependent oxidoreductase [Flavisolibacter sp.]